jgi:hypothetical protein
MTLQNQILNENHPQVTERDSGAIMQVGKNIATRMV